MKLAYFLNTYLTENLKTFISKNKCCGTISFKYDCCNNKKSWTASAIDESDVTTNLTYQLKHKEIIVLDYFKNQFKGDCCLEGKVLKLSCCNGIDKFVLENEVISLKLQTFLNEDSLGFPVGVFGIDNSYLGIANNANEYIAIWNAYAPNNSVATIDSITFDGVKWSGKLNVVDGQIPPINLIGLRFYKYTGYAGLKIYVGANDIVSYGSSVKKGNVDGILTSSDLIQEFNYQIFGTRGFEDKIPTTSVYVMDNADYIDGSDMYIFHNEDSVLVGQSQSYGIYTIAGNLPINLKYFYGIGQNNTRYDLLNFDELLQFESYVIEHSGGNPWQVDNQIYSLPNNWIKSNIKRLHIGQLQMPLTNLSFINNTNYDTLEELVITAFGNSYSGNAAWFLTIPKVTNYIQINYPTASFPMSLSSTDSDLMWNNIRIALDGVTPSGSLNKIKLYGTAAITAASLGSRNYLIAQGWTLIYT